ncbi:MAG: SDR family NAD(P)-dependent oxidoreductase [Nitrospiraceae bacterium]
MQSRPTALVTGASGGIGRAVCVAFAREGWWVGSHYGERHDEALLTLEALRRAGGEGALYQADIRRRDHVDAMVQALLRERPTLSAAVCNAGTTGSHLVLRHPEQEWTRIIETNLTGTFHCLQAIAGAMGPQGGGSILVVGSFAASQGRQGKRRMQPRKPVSSASSEARRENGRIKDSHQPGLPRLEGDEARRKSDAARGGIQRSPAGPPLRPRRGRAGYLLAGAVDGHVGTDLEPR